MFKKLLFAVPLLVGGKIYFSGGLSIFKNFPFVFTDEYFILSNPNKKKLFSLQVAMTALDSKQLNF
jgi:hypothetical protein